MAVPTYQNYVIHQNSATPVTTLNSLHLPVPELSNINSKPINYSGPVSNSLNSGNYKNTPTSFPETYPNTIPLISNQPIIAPQVPYLLNESRLPQNSSVNKQNSGPRLLRAKKLNINHDRNNSRSGQAKVQTDIEYESSPLRGSRRHSRQRTFSQPASRPSSQPSSRNQSPKREYINPQRYWEKDTTIPQRNQANYNQLIQNYQNPANRNNVVYTQHSQEGRQDHHYQQRPNHIHENSRRVTTYGADGTSYQSVATSIVHDGEEVYTKTAEEIKEDRINQLRNDGTVDKLEGSKRPNQIRIFVTRCSPFTTCRTVEDHILGNFEDVIHTHVRKTHMAKTQDYSSFVVIARSKPDVFLDIEYFQNGYWPDDIQVYPGRDLDEQHF